MGLLLAGLRRRLTERRLTLEVTDAALEARWRARATTRSTGRGRCDAPSSASSRTRWRAHMLAGDFLPGSTVVVDAVDGALTFNGVAEAARAPRALPTPGNSTTVN